MIEIFQKIHQHKENTLFITQDIVTVRVAMHQNCNLSCPFCINKELRTPSIYISKDSIKSSIDELAKYIKNKHIDLLLWGGELLQDRCSDSVFCQYIELVEYFKKVVCPTSIRISVFSNLMHVKTERCIELLHKLNSSLEASFDFGLRFANESQLKLFTDNIKAYKKAGIKTDLNVCLSSNNYSALLQKNSLEYSYFLECLNYIDEVKTIGLRYTNNTSSGHKKFIDSFKLSPKQIALFYIELDKLHPKSNILDMYKSTSKKQSNNCFAISINSDGSIIWTCVCPTTIIDFAKNNKCMTCKWYKTCNMSICFYSHKECYHKYLYSYIDENSILETD